MKLQKKIIQDITKTPLGEPLIYKDFQQRIKEKFNLFHGKRKRKNK